MAARWNSWWISFHGTLPILIYFGADGHIPQLRIPTENPVHTPRGQNPVLRKHKLHVKARRVDDQLFKIIM